MLLMELELSRPLDTAASRGNKGENPILFSVWGSHLSPRLSEQKNRANVLPSESLCSLQSLCKAAFCASGSCGHGSGARRREPRVSEGGRDVLRARIGQGSPRSPRSPPPSMLPGRAVGLVAAAAPPQLAGHPRPRWPVRRAGRGSPRHGSPASPIAPAAPDVPLEICRSRSNS